MDYHILETYTLKDMIRSLNKEIKSITQRLERLKEQQEIIDIIIIYRDDRDKNKHLCENNQLVNSDTVIDPLK